MQPERALKFLTLLTPANLDFYRTPIATPAPPPQRISPSIPASSAISAAAQALQGTKEASTTKAGIYGSVTTADIAANLKAILAEDESGSKISFSAEDIAFVEETEEKDRVKHLGVFEIDIQLKGAPDVIRRTIKVNPQA
jgi:ribosomal protein L9